MTSRVTDLSRALTASIVSVVWTIVAGAAAVIVGLRDESAVLVALGAIALLDAAASAILVEHFAHARRHQQRSERREDIAHRMVTAGLVAIGVTTAAVSIWRLVAGHTSKDSVASVVLAALSFVALAGLARWKRGLAVRIDSPALLGDSRISAIGSVQAAIAVGGTLVTRELDWVWADSAAALLVATLAVVVGVTTAPRRR